MLELLTSLSVTLSGLLSDNEKGATPTNKSGPLQFVVFKLGPLGGHPEVQGNDQNS